MLGIANLNRYPAYKPSGVEWLGEVPEHWTIERLKSSVDNILDQGIEQRGASVHIALEHVESWTGRIRYAAWDSSFDSQLKGFRSGDVLFGKLRPYLAKVARPTNGGCCVGEFLVLRPRYQGLRGAFLELFLRSKPVIDAVNSSTFGAKMPRADWRFIGGMSVVRPSLLEQSAIACFLNHIDRKIQRYIHAKQKLIVLLQEQKQAIIRHAVTGRIDVRTGRPYDAYKPSGVNWLEQVPAHWQVRRLKSICTMKSGEGITEMSIEPTGNYPVYGGNGIRGYTSNYTHDGNYALIGRQGALCGNVHTARDRFYASEHAVVVALRGRNVLEWFSAVLATMDLNQYSIAAAQPGLAVERVLNLWVPVPDSREQKVIATHIEQRTAGIDEAVARARCKIDLLREYRTRLIADVVTGKLDVREAAARLPEADPLASEEGIETVHTGVDSNPEECQAAQEVSL